MLSAFPVPVRGGAAAIATCTATTPTYSATFRASSIAIACNAPNAPSSTNA